MSQRVHITLALAVILCWLPGLHAQEGDYHIVRIADFDSCGSVWAAGLRPDGLTIEASRSQVSLWSDEGLESNVVTHSLMAKREATWNMYSPRLKRLTLAADSTAVIGTISEVNDSLVLFSLERDINDFPAGSIVTGEIKEGVISVLQSIAIPPVGGRFIHPCISPEGEQIVFAAYIPGTTSGYDLFFINRLDEGWSDPVSLGYEVNSAGNEVFPAWSANGRLVFSSDGHGGQGGLDLYYTSRSSQWQECSALPGPFNSVEDDFLYLELADGDGFISSNRDGEDAVYRVQQIPADGYATGLSALFVSAGTPVQDAQITIYNMLGERVLENHTDENGRFNIESLELSRSYRAVFEGVPQALLEKSLLFILDEEGNRVMVISPNVESSFFFELMTMSELQELTLLENRDESQLLSVSVKGQVYDEVPGDIDEGELIYVVDSEGVLMAVSYTGAEGRFRFDDLRPEAKYAFQLDEESNASNIRISDSGEAVDIKVHNGKAIYQRVQEGDAVSLVNELGERIVIRNEELFVISHIYYEFSDHKLTERARTQLDQLMRILERNPGIYVEIHSHTDSRGSAEFNLALSQRRAASASEYLISNGIAKQRISSAGYGEEKLLNDCTDNVECDEDQHAVNRRTEIRIVE